MNREVCKHFTPVDLPCAKCKEPPTLREAATLALEAIDWLRLHLRRDHQCLHMDPAQSGIPAWIAKSETSLRAALAEPEMERNFCPRCGKRSFPDTIHTCTPP